jgi:hypothetical protein
MLRQRPHFGRPMRDPSTVLDKPHARIRFATGTIVLLACLLTFALQAGCDRQQRSHQDNIPRAGKEGEEAANGGAKSSANDEMVVAFCGDCHVMPDPASFPKDAWHAEVRRGFEFYFASGRTDLALPKSVDVQDYFVQRAPEALQNRPPGDVDATLVGKFARQEVTIPDATDAAISFVDVIDAGPGMGRGIVFSDMRNGGVYFAPIGEGKTVQSPKKIGVAHHPATVRCTDWDGDGASDFLVADLGSFLPADHDKGQVLLFRQSPDSPGQFDIEVVVDNIGRVASVEVADFDLDGTNDVLVAEFGWHDTGSIFWLQRSERDGVLSKRAIDSRNGTIHVPVVDLNQDGAPDFVALFSQEHERIEAMINDGTGNFQRELIYAAPDPAFGSSGIVLSDFNRDGQIDVIYTNGDSFDSFLIKPYHGIRLLENEGRYPFTHHHLGAMPGVHRAVVGDVDGNGVSDIVAGAFIPRDLQRGTLGMSSNPSEALVAWLGSDAGGYEKHVLEIEACLHAALTVADLDRDGNSEIVVGNFHESGVQPGPALTVWWKR